ncbi:MAG: CBS domain-containing protein [Candidatus Methanoliparum thermophilum]|uniref:CBS domain-containing protein n=1 Tax=Methanoliparum thermophilum TaxID=2491083 RepID=A0A520KR05_METT2|nr:CBS domain-containing protein [Candidatus Methanoliparum sp. LAM-1]RZN64043.1 MAG: CBS domain-containing protein [Candidatus Methanoliparum thermophilum]BDC35702.1 hypothetical protein MTLP_03840 [Candidatus Methanoliparum sp. LAM-1]
MPIDYRTILDKFYEKRVKDVMESRLSVIPIIDQNMGIMETAAFIAVNNHAWVVKSRDSRRLVGVITEKDFLNILRPGKKISYFGVPNKTSLNYEFFENAENIMSKNPIICTEEEKIKDVLDKMTFHNVRSLPVLKDEEIVGEITIHQLIIKFYNIINSW